MNKTGVIQMLELVLTYFYEDPALQKSNSYVRETIWTEEKVGSLYNKTKRMADIERYCWEFLGNVLASSDNWSSYGTL